MDRPCSILAIDPHDEFQTCARSGGRDGIRGIVNQYNPQQFQNLVEPLLPHQQKCDGPRRTANEFIVGRHHPSGSDQCGGDD